MFEIEIDSGIATINMKHGKVNAMSLEFLQLLNGHLRSLADADEVKQVVVAGNERVFSAGVDLKRLVAEQNEYLDLFLPELTGMFLEVFCFPKPLVAAVTGHAVAGGCVLACAADYRVISEQAKIGVPELRVGVPFPSSGMEIMRWAANAQAFRQIINTGATFTGAQAVQAGLADESALPDRVIEVARESTKPFSVVPPKVFQLTKRQMRQPIVDRITRSQELFGDDIDQLWRDQATRDAVAAYVAERLG